MDFQDIFFIIAVSGLGALLIIVSEYLINSL
jgi:hypothetical protein